MPNHGSTLFHYATVWSVYTGDNSKFDRESSTYTHIMHPSLRLAYLAFA